MCYKYSFEGAMNDEYENLHVINLVLGLIWHVVNSRRVVDCFEYVPNLGFERNVFFCQMDGHHFQE
jgi:hypothetical protein